MRPAAFPAAGLLPSSAHPHTQPAGVQPGVQPAVPAPRVPAGAGGPKQRPRRRRGRQPHRLGLSLLVLSLVGAFGAAGSWAAWTVTDSNTGNTFTSTTVLLADNQGGQGGSATTTGSAMFNVTDLSPGSSATTACIGVAITGTATPTALTLSATLGGANAATLGPALTMNVATYNTSGTVSTNGTNTNNSSCASYPGGGSNVTIGSQGATLTAWAAGGPYTIASIGTQTWYKFTVSGLPGGSSCATYCGKTMTVDLTWTLTAT